MRVPRLSPHPALLRPMRAGMAMVTMIAMAACMRVNPAPPTGIPILAPTATPIVGIKPVTFTNPTVIKGTVRAPSGIVAAGGGNLIGQGGSTIVAGGGGNLVGKGGAGLRAPFGLLAANEQPLAGVMVVLADAAGNPYPAIAPVQTDAQGNYTFPMVPADFTYMVQAAILTKNKQGARLQTLARPTSLGSTADLSVASTCVTIAVIEGKSNVSGAVDPLVFQRAVDATRDNLAAEAWPNIADRQAVLTKMSQLATKVDALKAALDQLRTDVAKLSTRLDALTKVVEELQKPVDYPIILASPVASPEVSIEASPVIQPTPFGSVGTDVVEDDFGRRVSVDLVLELSSPSDDQTRAPNVTLRIEPFSSLIQALGIVAADYTSDQDGLIQARIVVYDTNYFKIDGQENEAPYGLFYVKPDGDERIGYFEVNNNLFGNDRNFQLVYTPEGGNPVQVKLKSFTKLGVAPSPSPSPGKSTD